MYKKALPAAMVVAALATLTAAPAAAAAPAATGRVGIGNHTTHFVMEGKNREFTCPTNKVMTARWHDGDENGLTGYHCSTVYVDGQEVQVSMGGWDLGMKENISKFIAPTDQVIVGRWHQGDENGLTRYRTAALYWQGKLMRITSPMWTELYDENDHQAFAGDGQVITGRIHRGDENGSTIYQYSTVTLGS